MEPILHRKALKDIVTFWRNALELEDTVLDESRGKISEWDWVQREHRLAINEFFFACLRRRVESDYELRLDMDSWSKIDFDEWCCQETRTVLRFYADAIKIEHDLLKTFPRNSDVITVRQKILWNNVTFYSIMSMYNADS